jgi:hypothetical protein
VWKRRRRRKVHSTAQNKINGCFPMPKQTHTLRDGTGEKLAAMQTVTIKAGCIMSPISQMRLQALPGAEHIVFKQKLLP